MPAKIADLVLAFVALALFTRLFSTADYSLFVLVWAAASAVHTIGVGWLHLTALRYWKEANTPAQSAPFLSAVNVSLAAGLACALVIWFLGSRILLPDVGATTVIAGAVLLCTYALNQQAITRARALRQFGSFLWLSLLPRVVMLAVGGWAASTEFNNADSLLLALALGYGVTVAIEALRNGRGYWPHQFQIDSVQLKRIVSYGTPVAWVALSQVVLTLSDRFMIAHFHGTQTAGEYTLAYNVISKADSLTVFVGAAAFPILIERYVEHGPQETARDLSRLLTVFCAAFLPLTVGLALVAKPVCSVLLGESYSAAPATVVALAPAVFAAGVLRYLARPFQITGAVKPQLILSAGCGALNLVSSALLIAQWGPLGAAWGTGACLTLCCVGHYLWSQRVLPYSVQWKEIGKVLVATVLMGACTTIALGVPLTPGFSLLLAAGVGAASYLSAAALLNIAALRGHLQRLWVRAKA